MKNDLSNESEAIPPKFRSLPRDHQVRNATPARPLPSGPSAQSRHKVPDLESAYPGLTIEWKHLDRGGKTCNRCGDTGRTLRKSVRALRRQCNRSGVAIHFKEIKLPARRLEESNEILFNGMPLEIALGDAEVHASDCDSCSTLVDAPAQCRAVRQRGKTYEAIPDELIRQAACRVAGCPCRPHPKQQLPNYRSNDSN